MVDKGRSRGLGEVKIVTEEIMDIQGISSGPYRIPERAEAKGSDSFCTKVMNVIKDILPTIVYYLTCCQGDLSRLKKREKNCKEEPKAAVKGFSEEEVKIFETSPE